MRIELDCGHTEGAAFAKWLCGRGYDARVGQTSGNFVDGSWTQHDSDARLALLRLWEQYCDCCGSELGGARQQFVQLGPEQTEREQLMIEHTNRILD